VPRPMLTGLIAFSARIAPSETAAASSNVMASGMWAIGPVSRTLTNSAWAPNMLAPTSPANSVPRILLFGRRRPVNKRLKNGLAARMRRPTG
jgi:hypothetical protein